jgi:flagellar basal-body rod protein FlgF
MDNVTSIALSRLVAQQRANDVTATNLANAATPGFHAERVVFSDWLVKARGTTVPGNGTIAFTQDRATYRDTHTGPLQHTANPLDLAIGGDGYFSVQTPDGVRLTRAGHFSTSTNGDIVDGQGNALLTATGGYLRLSPTDHEITIAADGTLTTNNGQIGRIGIVRPDNDQTLRAEGGQLSAATSPTKTVVEPKLIQGAVEGSNIQPTVELTRMMSDLREFQFTSELVQAEADRQRAAIDKLTQTRS